MELTKTLNGIDEKERLEEEAKWENQRKPFLEELKAELADINRRQREELEVKATFKMSSTVLVNIYIG